MIKAIQFLSVLAMAMALSACTGGEGGRFSDAMSRVSGVFGEEASSVYRNAKTEKECRTVGGVWIDDECTRPSSARKSSNK